MSTTEQITAHSRIGQVLLALRAGAMSSAELTDRIPTLPSLRLLERQGYVTGNDDGWRITDAGRAACPLRNPLAGKIASPVATHRPDRPEPQGDSTVARDSRTDTLSAVKQVSGLLIDVPAGISRKDLIKRTGLTEARVDNAIVNLIKSGKAERKGYGLIAPVAAGVKSIEAGMMDKAPMDRTGAIAADSAIPEIDFMIHADGRLSIVDGDQVLVLPSSATRRLRNFLDCLEMKPWQARPDERIHP